MKFTMSETDGLIRNVDPFDEPILRHCSNNSIAVTEKFFDEFVEPLLFLHGIKVTECDWRGDES